MANVLLIVEGETEEQFYKKELQKLYLLPDGGYRHYLEVVQLPSTKNTTLRGKKGGSVSYAVCLKNMKRFLAQNAHCQLVMLILDYYGIHHTFREHLTSQQTSLSDRVQAIQDRLERDVQDDRFRFRLQAHEFEAYLFSDPNTVCTHFNQAGKLHDLQKILTAFGNDPEKINDSPQTAPSKRLETHFPGFGKITDGLAIASKIGIPIIRKRCKFFDDMIALIDVLD